MCRRKASGLALMPTVHLQSMVDLDLPRRYRTIIVPSSSFQLVLDRDEAGKALRTFHRHLETGGTLAMPIIVLDMPADEVWTREAALEDGTTVRRTSRATFDPSRRFESTDDLYELFRDGELTRSERHVREHATLSWTPDELRDALVQNGFGDLEFLSGFTRRPRQAGDEVFTVLARSG